MSSTPMSCIKVEPVSDPSELPAVASIFHTAIKASGDNLHEVFVRYGGDTYQGTINRLQAALSTSTDDKSLEQHFIFKAVETVPRNSPVDEKKDGREGSGAMLQETSSEEKIIGMAQWTVGYIDLPKVDPFEQRAASASTSAATEDSATLEEPIAASGERGTASEPELEPFDFYAVCRKPVRNIYISQIRGKKHVYLRRIAVHPDYQRRGVARQLLQWGLDRADSEKLISYLNARPQAQQLYENGGFKVVKIVPMPVPGFEVSGMIVMVRHPQLVKSC